MSRSSYDQQLQRMWGDQMEGYNAPPWPATSAPQFRTRYDARVQKGWCANCDKPRAMPHPQAVFPPREGFEPLFGFRTSYDKKLQQHWCPRCNGSSPHHDPMGQFSFVCSPGLGCHRDNRAPGHGSDGVRYSNLQACDSKCKSPGPDGAFSFVCSPGLEK